MPSERTALYLLDESKFDAFGSSDVGFSFVAARVAALESEGVLRVVDWEALADKVWDLYVNSGSVLSVREAVFGALEAVSHDR